LTSPQRKEEMERSSNLEDQVQVFQDQVQALEGKLRAAGEVVVLKRENNKELGEP